MEAEALGAYHEAGVISKRSTLEEVLGFIANQPALGQFHVNFACKSQHNDTGQTSCAGTISASAETCTSTESETTCHHN